MEDSEDKRNEQASGPTDLTDNGVVTPEGSHDGVVDGQMLVSVQLL
jgi:hypothetical protein